MLTIEVCPREPSAVLSWHGKAPQHSPHWLRIQAACQSGDNTPAIRALIRTVPIAWRIVRKVSNGYVNSEALPSEIVSTAQALCCDDDATFTIQEAREYCVWLACWSAVEEAAA